MPPTQALPDAQSESTFTPPSALCSWHCNPLKCSSCSHVLKCRPYMYVCVCIVECTSHPLLTPRAPSPHLTSPHFAPVSMAAVKSCCRCVSADVMTLSPVHNPAISQLHSPPCSTHSATPSPLWAAQKRGIWARESAIDDGIKSRWLITGYACTHLFYGLY